MERGTGDNSVPERVASLEASLKDHLRYCEEREGRTQDLIEKHRRSLANSHQRIDEIEKSRIQEQKDRNKQMYGLLMAMFIAALSLACSLIVILVDGK